MKIAILGAGFTGLSCAYDLVTKGHDVWLFEKDSQPGGLAIGYQERDWEWSLERHYHHWFTNDESILTLAKEIGHGVNIRRPRTSVYVDGQIYQLDSPVSALLFPKLSLFSRLRMGLVLALLRYNPLWKPLEGLRASEILPIAMGSKPYKLLWQPMLESKFGEFASEVSLAWFWARIKKRTTKLAYPKGGFLHFANHLVDMIINRGGKVFFNTEATEIKDVNEHVLVVIKKGKGKEEKYTFDKVVVTLPSFLFLKIAPQLPESYRNSLAKLKGLGATNLLLRLKKPFFSDHTYWLSVADINSPIMAIVEHTNFMDKAHYNNEHLVYLGNYLPANHVQFSMTKEQLLTKFDPFLRKINPGYKKHLIDYELFKAPFAQPIIPINYSKLIPPMTTPLSHVFLANIEQVYPWDRGTNYAVELGRKVASIVLHQSSS